MLKIVVCQFNEGEEKSGGFEGIFDPAEAYTSKFVELIGDIRVLNIVRIDYLPCVCSTHRDE